MRRWVWSMQVDIVVYTRRCIASRIMIRSRNPTDKKFLGSLEARLMQ